MLKTKHSGERVYKVFIYVVLLAMAISIVVPVFWVFMASIKQNVEFYENPLGPAHGLLLAELRRRLAEGQHGQLYAQLGDSHRPGPRDTHNRRPAGGLLPLPLQVQEP